jgi:hypothetical protein
MPLRQHHVKEIAEGCAVIASFNREDKCSIGGMYYSSSVNQPASSLRKPGNDSNQLAPDGSSNSSSSHILHTRAQFAAQ